MIAVRRLIGVRHSSRVLRSVATVLVAVLFVACGAIQEGGNAAPCDFGNVQFSSDFPGGRIDGCEQTGPLSYRITLSPENSPINHSPWYSFKVIAATVSNVQVSLSYTEHEHRYVPKLSDDGQHWRPIAEDKICVGDQGGTATLSLELGPKPLWVSAQELIDKEDYDSLYRKWAALPYIETAVVGKSVNGRDIVKLETVPVDHQRYIVLTGRQHPPEVTGALAMIAFLDRLFAEDDLAQRFRAQFGILTVPNMNPDGVALGNWRHNANGIDLNRDWGPFGQPETQAVKAELQRFVAPASSQLYLFLDFHSTGKDVLYSQLPEMQTFPPDFTQQWIVAIQERAQLLQEGYEVNWAPGNNPDVPTSKAYMYATFGIPSITFELGDETDREFIDAYSVAAAEELMKNLLVVAESEPQ